MKNQDDIKKAAGPLRDKNITVQPAAKPNPGAVPNNKPKPSGGGPAKAKAPGRSR